jgi:hypothetical protein
LRRRDRNLKCKRDVVMWNDFWWVLYATLLYMAVITPLGVGVMFYFIHKLEKELKDGKVRSDRWSF